MGESAIICDTTLPLYLGRIGQAQLLPALFGSISIPHAVVLELDMGRLLRRDTIDPRTLDWMTVVSVSEHEVEALPPNRLGIGERETIAYARGHPDCVVGLDDLQARALAQDLALAVVGTLGILLRAKRAELVSTIRPLLGSLRAEGFHLGDDLYHQALQLAGED